jgi:hypothetical protein
LWDNLEKYWTGRNARDDKIIWLIFSGWRITKAINTHTHTHTHTHKRCKIYCFSQATMVANAPQCYVIRIFILVFLSRFTYAHQLVLHHNVFLTDTLVQFAARCRCVTVGREAWRQFYTRVAGNTCFPLRCITTKILFFTTLTHRMYLINILSYSTQVIEVYTWTVIRWIYKHQVLSFPALWLCIVRP